MVSSIIERIKKGISAAQDKSIFGSSASLSRYAKKYYNVMILT